MSLRRRKGLRRVPWRKWQGSREVFRQRSRPGESGRKGVLEEGISVSMSCHLKTPLNFDLK